VAVTTAAAVTFLVGAAAGVAFWQARIARAQQRMHEDVIRLEHDVCFELTAPVAIFVLLTQQPIFGAANPVNHLVQPEVKPAGLGARDTLRLEAGLCLYGHDINETTTPVEAALTWAIQKVRRPGGARAGGYPGASAIQGQLTTGPVTKRVGLLGLERVPVREGAKIVDAHGRALGHVTSGTLAPSVNQPIAMAYLAANHALPSHEVYAEVRGKRLPMRVTPMPFAPHRYYRG